MPSSLLGWPRICSSPRTLSLGPPELCGAEIVTSNLEKGLRVSGWEEQERRAVLWVFSELWLPRCCISALLPSHSCPSWTLSFRKTKLSTSMSFYHLSLLNCFWFYGMRLFHTCPPAPTTHKAWENGFEKRGKIPHCLCQHRIIKNLPGASPWFYLSVVDSLTPLKV